MNELALQKDESARQKAELDDLKKLNEQYSRQKPTSNTDALEKQIPILNQFKLKTEKALGNLERLQSQIFQEFEQKTAILGKRIQEQQANQASSIDASLPAANLQQRKLDELMNEQALQKAESARQKAELDDLKKFRDKIELFRKYQESQRTTEPLQKTSLPTRSQTNEATKLIKAAAPENPVITQRAPAHTLDPNEPIHQASEADETDDTETPVNYKHFFYALCLFANIPYKLVSYFILDTEDADEQADVDLYSDKIETLINDKKIWMDEKYEIMHCSADLQETSKTLLRQMSSSTRTNVLCGIASALGRYCQEYPGEIESIKNPLEKILMNLNIGLKTRMNKSSKQSFFSQQPEDIQEIKDIKKLLHNYLMLYSYLIFFYKNAENNGKDTTFLEEDPQSLMLWLSVWEAIRELPAFSILSEQERQFYIDTVNNAYEGKPPSFEEEGTCRFGKLG